jgi:hypothetical protein
MKDIKRGAKEVSKRCERCAKEVRKRCERGVKEAERGVKDEALLPYQPHIKVEDAKRHTLLHSLLVSST